MKTDIKGCSTCPKGRELYEWLSHNGSDFVQYDYRTPDGRLFSCVARSLDAARIQRDKWEKGSAR